MSRVDENQELLNRAQLSFTGAPEKVMCNIEAQKLGILMDISKSLAIIADANVIYKPIRDPKDLFNAFPPKEEDDEPGNS